jgi:hypothetical protein
MTKIMIVVFLIFKETIEQFSSMGSVIFRLSSEKLGLQLQYIDVQTNKIARYGTSGKYL